MKVTNRNAREDRAGKHNDRNFNLDNAEHIDQERVKLNKYYTYNGDTEHTFAEIEQDFYETHFSQKVETQNKINESVRHPERNRTIEDYYHNKTTRPEDKILQIGNKFNHASGEELWECALAYKDKFNELYGDKCMILDMALHLDEETPHVHVRRVWIAEDENGLECVSQTKALEQMGISRPDSSQPEGKYNNAKITFTRTDLELFREVCIEHGLDVEESKENKNKHLETAEFKRVKLSEEIEVLERKLEHLQQQFGDVDKGKEVSEELQSVMDRVIDYFENEPFFYEQFQFQIEEAKKKTRVEEFEILVKLYREAMENQIESGESIETVIATSKDRAEINRLKGFIESKGLTEEYEQSGKPKQVAHETSIHSFF